MFDAKNLIFKRELGPGVIQVAVCECSFDDDKASLTKTIYAGTKKLAADGYLLERDEFFEIGKRMGWIRRD